MRQVSRSLGGASYILLAASLWGTTATARTFAPAGASPVAVGAVRVIGGGLLLFVVALRGGALRGLVTRGTRTRCLLAIGAAPVFTGILSMMTGRRSRTGARWLAAAAAAITGCAMLVTSGAI